MIIEGPVEYAPTRPKQMVFIFLWTSPSSIIAAIVRWGLFFSMATKRCPWLAVCLLVVSRAYACDSDQCSTSLDPGNTVRASTTRDQSHPVLPPCSNVVTQLSSVPRLREATAATAKAKISIGRALRCRTVFGSHCTLITGDCSLPQVHGRGRSLLQTQTVPRQRVSSAREPGKHMHRHGRWDIFLPVWGER